jgi:hypothetical protein
MVLDTFKERLKDIWSDRTYRGTIILILALIVIAVFQLRQIG